MDRNLTDESKNVEMKTIEHNSPSTLKASVIKEETVEINNQVKTSIDPKDCNPEDNDDKKTTISNTTIKITNDSEDKTHTHLERTEFLGEAPLVQTIWTLTYPDLIGKIVTASYTFADAVYIGNLGGNTQEEKSLALGSVSFAMPIEQAFQNGLALLYASGLATTLGRYLGQHNKKMAESTLGNLYFLCIVGGILYPLIILPFMKYLLMALGASDEAGTLHIALTYISIITLGSIFTNFSFGNNNIIRAEGQAKWSASIKVIGGVFNICMDPVFIATFGLGVNGAALCTVISNLLISILGISYYLCKKSVVSLTWEGMKPNWTIIKDGLYIGISGCLLTMSSSIVTLVFNRLVVAFSPYPSSSIETTELISVVGALSKVTYMIFLPMLALSHGVLPILSYCKGAKKNQRFRDCLKVCFIGGILLGSILDILAYFLAPYIALMFSSSSRFVETFTIAFRYQTCCLPLGACFFALLPALQASNRGLLAGFLAIMKNCLFLIIGAICFDYVRQDYWGFAYAYPVAEICSCILSIILFYSFKDKLFDNEE